MPRFPVSLSSRLARVGTFAVLVLGGSTARLALAANASLPEPEQKISGSSRARFTWEPIQVPSGPVTDSEFALFHLQRALYDPVDPRLLGSLSPDLQFRVNGEVYRFGAETTLRKFMQEPELWCGLLRDPVSGSRFVPSTRTPRVYFVGGPYYFSSDSTRDRFLDDPGRYEVKRAL